jgi:hypothetical protein
LTFTRLAEASTISPLLEEISNPKSQISNKFEIQRKKISNAPIESFEFFAWNLFEISNLKFEISFPHGGYGDKAET